MLLLTLEILKNTYPKYSWLFISAYPWIQPKDQKYLKQKFNEIPTNKT